MISLLQKIRKGRRVCLVLVLIMAGILAPVSENSTHRLRAGRMRREIGLKEAFALTRTESERIDRQDMIHFDGALYVHRSPCFGRAPGIIDGGNHYAIRSPGSLPVPLFALNNVEIKSSSGSGILGNLPREDYQDMVSFLRNDDRKRCLVASDMESPAQGNVNPMILAPYARHEDYESEQVTVYRDVGGRKTSVGTYTYTMNAGRALMKAVLTVNENCSLDLPSGTYYLTGLILEKNATLTGAGPITVFCTGEVLLQPGSRITGDEEDPRNFSLLCSRSRTDDKVRPSIEILDGCEFVGTILAPEWDLIFHQGVTLTGGIIVGLFMVRGPASQPWRIEFFDSLASQNPSSCLDMAVSGQRTI
jgi:hypothetical protein